jgi:3-hydroxyisobutyrate dehydrogenase-like beta-hydroxyacid dehydrogenase
MATVGFIGMGTMGKGMALNLSKAGHTVKTWNRTPFDSGELGASPAASISEVMDGADYVMYCLGDDTGVNDVVFGDGGILEHVTDSQVVIDLSTIDPETSAKESQAYSERGVKFLDAPVFGSKGETNAGGLWIVVGGDRAVFDSAAEVLEPISETTHYMGPSGSGAKMKLVGNLIVAAQLEALGEALTLAKNADLDLNDVLGVLHVTDFKSPIFDGVGAAVVAGDYSPSFALKWMLKDANLVAAFAERLNSPVPGTMATRATIAEAVEQGWGEENASALIKVLAQHGNVDLSK